MLYYAILCYTMLYYTILHYTTAVSPLTPEVPAGRRARTGAMAIESDARAQKRVNRESDVRVQKDIRPVRLLRI